MALFQRKEPTTPAGKARQSLLGMIARLGCCAYLIYTDDRSKKEMLRRSRRFVGAVLIMYAIIIPYMIFSLARDWFFSHSEDLASVEIWTPILLGIAAYMFLRWYISVRRMEKGKKPRRFHYFAYVAVSIAVIIISMGSILLNFFGVI